MQYCKTWDRCTGAPSKRRLQVDFFLSPCQNPPVLMSFMLQVFGYLFHHVTSSYYLNTNPVHVHYSICMLQVKQRISHLSPLSLTGFLLCFDRGIAITLMRCGLSPLALSHADSKFNYFLNAHTGNPMACRLYRYRTSRMRMPSRLWIMFLWVIVCFSPFFCSGAFAKNYV